MDVILLTHVEKVGAEGSVVHVKPGFARNYLIPRGLAVLATAATRKTIEALQRQRIQQVRRMQEEAETLKRRIEGCSLTLTLSLGADEKPFGSVTVHDLVDALAREGITVEKSTLQLEQPLKALGMYDVPVRLHPHVTATVKVCIAKA